MGVWPGRDGHKGKQHRSDEGEQGVQQMHRAGRVSLKTAQQQDVAHRINEIGVKTDQEAQTAMASIGTATNQKMADMLDAHEDHMVFARDVLEKKAKADERFARRFAKIVEKHDKNLYGG